MSIMDDYYGKIPQEHIRKNFDVESLKRSIGFAQDDLKMIRQYIQAAQDQVAVAEKVTFRNYVEFRKENNYCTHHINYRFLVYRLPDIPNAHNVADYESLTVPELNGKEKGSFNNPFLGNEKKAAVEFARMLAKKYDATIS